MGKRTATKWFNKRASQSTNTNMAGMVSLSKTGPNDSPKRERKEDENGNKFFIVGKSEIGGDEII